jgi:homospermidine synthase
MIGFGSIARGTLPLLDRHIDFDHSRCTVIEPVSREADRKVTRMHSF